MQQVSIPAAKLSYLRKLFLKCTDRKAYYELKNRIRREEVYRNTIAFYSHGPQIPDSTTGDSLSFKHSGNAGDIIYSLPCIRALAEGRPTRLHLKLDVPMRARHLPHPLNGVQLDRQMYEKLLPLLSAQSYINKIDVYNNDILIDHDLDAFRDTPMPLDRLAISRWYFFMTGAAADLSKPWLSAIPDTNFSDHIVIARSFRYRNPGINYQSLNRYKKLLFIGIKNEYEDIKSQVKDITYHPVSDFMEMARIIAGCRLFIGNQSFPYSVAEGLKRPRLLEIDPETPNVIPVGDTAYEILFQNQFEYTLSKLLGP